MRLGKVIGDWIGHLSGSLEENFFKLPFHDSSKKLQLLRKINLRTLTFPSEKLFLLVFSTKAIPYQLCLKFIRMNSILMRVTFPLS